MPQQPAFILVLNCGSSSVKFGLFGSDGLTCGGRGSITGIGNGVPAVKASGTVLPAECPPIGECRTVSDATRWLVNWLEGVLPPDSLMAVGHRIVHGGERSQHALVTPELIQDVKKLIPFFPLHQPFNIEAVEIMAKLHPNVPQVACFDTAFHATIPPLHRRIALPREWHDRGVRRYGFHGLSYEYSSAQLRKISPVAFAGRTIVAHLGNGASLCAMKGGVSFDTTMGFSSLDGVVMGTRCGNTDVGVLLYLIRECGMGAPELEKLLYKQSGLLGVSGISSDMEVLLGSHEANAAEAVDVFCLSVLRESSKFIGLMGGVDAFVFTGGIGEHAQVIRSRIIRSLGWAGLALDEAANLAAGGGDVPLLLSSPQASTQIWMIPTNEEAVIAGHTVALARK